MGDKPGHPFRGNQWTAGRWDQVKTGQPIVLNGFRGEGVYGGLSVEQQAKFGREFLLGEGIYVAPTKTLAGHFGEVRPVSVRMKNPYVIEAANTESLRDLDLEQIKKDGHDGIVIRKGQAFFGRNQEDLKQVVVFDKSQFREGHAEPGGLDKGTVVRIKDVAVAKYAGPTFRADARAQVGKIGKVTSFDAWGNPSVRVGGKTYHFNADEVEKEPTDYEKNPPKRVGK
jgi:hypothetical protein